MHRTVLILIAALLLPLLPSAGAVESSPDFAAEWSSATSAAFSSSGAIIMGKPDPRANSQFEPADAPVWAMWDAQGTRIKVGSADLEGCTPILLNQCVSNVVDVAIDTTGKRAVIASNDQQGGARLTFFTEAQGVFHQVELGGALQAMHANPDLTTIAVTADAYVASYGWTIGSSGSPGVISSNWQHTTQPLLSSDFRDGSLVAASQQRFYRVQDDGILRTHNLPVASVAVATTKDWSAVSLNDGRIRLYGPQSNVAPYSHGWEFHVDNNAVQALEFSPDSKRFLAASTSLRTYANPILDPDVARIQSTESLAVQQMVWSSGQQVLAKGNSIVSRINETRGIWEHTFSSAVKEVFVSTDGLKFAAFQAAKTHKFLPDWDVEWAVTADLRGLPGTSLSTPWMIANHGNRISTVAITTAGDFAMASPSAFLMFPGEEKTISFTVAIPNGTLAGEYANAVTLKAREQQIETTPLLVTVSEAPGWSIGGPPSLVLEPGVAAEITLVVTNTGNAANQTLVNLESSQDWGVIQSVTSLDLAAGAAGEVKIGFTPPVGAAHLSEIFLNVTIPGFGTHEIQGVVGGVHGVSVGAGKSDSVVLGNTTTATFSVTNAGNIADSYQLSITSLPAGWTANVLESSNPTAPIAAGASGTFTIQIQTAATSTEGTYAVRVNAVSISEPTATGTNTVTVPTFAGESSSSSSSSTTESKDSPFPAPFLLIALAGILWKKAKRI